jgi:hypothetical protein
MRRGAPDDDRRAHRARAEQEDLAVRLDLVGGEALVEQGERRVGGSAPTPRVDAERPEFLLHPAEPDAQDQSSPRQLLNRCRPLRDQQGRTVGDDQHADRQAHALGDPGEIGKRRERLDVAPVRSLRILRRERQVVGDPEIVDAGLLRGAGRIRDQSAGRLRAHVPQVEAKLHVAGRAR